MSYRLITPKVFSLLKKSSRKRRTNSENFCRPFSNDGKRTGKFEISGTQTIGDLLRKWTDKFSNNFIYEPQESIEHILAHCLGTRQIPEIYKLKNRILDELEVQRITELCNERLKKKPIQYVIKEWDFRNLTLEMRPPVFIPRQETEMLVDLINEEISKSQCKNILEICCGSGAISLSILKENLTIEKAVAVDASEAACELTEKNAGKYNLNDRLQIVQTLVDGMSASSIFPNEMFDLIVSNPPYIPTEVISTLQPEILLYEDLRALDGGSNGLDVIKTILTLSSHILKGNGKIFLEVDPSQPPLLQSWITMKCPNLIWEQTVRDFCDKDRFVVIKKL